ncbi:hypothetical protein 2050H1_049 [Serratia phage 2050H1]|uniref:Uncharacterized protein n=1 Tax=Serratia phage 2050H1 TaxID=2024250 RepID=A0A249Y2A1_9CAUD|nr:hypothetical protein 2050H1_049 [Serratia phage 2050H1]
MKTSKEANRNARITEIVSWINSNNINFIAPVYPTPAGWQWHQDHNTKAFYLIFMAPSDKDHIIVDQAFMKQFETAADIMTRNGDILFIDLNQDRLLVHADQELNFYMAGTAPSTHAERVAYLRKRPFMVMSGDTQNTIGLMRELSRTLLLGNGKARLTPGARNIMNQVFTMMQGMVNNRVLTSCGWQPMDDNTRYSTSVQLIKSVTTMAHIMMLEAKSANKSEGSVQPQDFGGQED